MAVCCSLPAASDSAAAVTPICPMAAAVRFAKRWPREAASLEQEMDDYGRATIAERLDMIHLPPSEVVSYLNQFRIHGLYIIGPPSGRPCVIGGAVDLNRVVGHIGRKWTRIFAGSQPVLHAVWWADRASVARVIELATHDMRGAWHGNSLIDADAAAVTAAVTGAARRLDIRLADHATVMTRVSGQVGKIKQRIEGSRQSGGLSAFNAEFRRRRLLAQRTGARFPPYGAALRRLRAAMATAAATGGTATPLAIFDQVLGAD